MYAYNPLESKPIVKTRRSGYVLPIPPYLMARVGMGVYYDLIKAHESRFSNVFGKVFEAYVGDLLHEVYPADQFCPELPYGSRNGNLSSDWAVIEDRSATLMGARSLGCGSRQRHAVQSKTYARTCLEDWREQSHNCTELSRQSTSASPG